MLYSLSGTITHIAEKTLCLESASIGFEVSVPDESKFSLGSTVKMYLYMHWNQEQGPSMYGFLTELEKRVFLLIISCSGIGPRIGLAMLSNLSPADVIQAIATEDLKMLSSVPGIGTKKAEQIVVHLKHKVTQLLQSGASLGTDVRMKTLQSVSEVLTSLNYSRPEITSALQHLREQTSEQEPFDQQLRKALSFLSKLP